MMSKVEISRDEIEKIVSKIKRYFADELEQDIGAFEAEFLINFFEKEIGPYFYNKGLSDAHTVFSEKTEEISYLLQELEKPID